MNSGKLLGQPIIEPTRPSLRVDQHGRANAVVTASRVYAVYRTETQPVVTGDGFFNIPWPLNEQNVSALKQEIAKTASKALLNATGTIASVQETVVVLTLIAPAE